MSSYGQFTNPSVTTDPRDANKWTSGQSQETYNPITSGNIETGSLVYTKRCCLKNRILFMKITNRIQVLEYFHAPWEGELRVTPKLSIVLLYKCSSNNNKIVKIKVVYF